MIGSISCSTRGKGKGYTFGFTECEFDSLEHLATIMNTRAVSAAVFRNGHRKKEHIERLLPILLLDIDRKGMSELIEASLERFSIGYVRVPSASWADNRYKYHYAILLDGTPSLENYRDKVVAVLKSVRIDPVWVDIKAVEPARQLAPAKIDKETAKVMDSAVKIHYGSPLPIHVASSFEENGKDQDGTPKSDLDLESLDAVKKVMGDLVLLDATMEIVTEKGTMRLSDLEKEIEVGDTTSTIRCDCPIHNPEHEDGLGADYAYAFRSTESGKIVIKCSGAHCDGRIYAIYDRDSYRSGGDRVWFELNSADVMNLWEAGKAHRSIMYVYCTLVETAVRQKTNRIWITNSFLVDKFGTSESDIKLSIRYLKELGYVTGRKFDQRAKKYFMELPFVSNRSLHPIHCKICGSVLSRNCHDTFCTVCGNRFEIDDDAA